MLTFKSPVGREAEGKNSQMYFLSQFSVRCIFSCFARLIKNEYLKYQTCRDGGHMSRTHTTPPPPLQGCGVPIVPAEGGPRVLCVSH